MKYKKPCKANCLLCKRERRGKCSVFKLKAQQCRFHVRERTYFAPRQHLSFQQCLSFNPRPSCVCEKTELACRCHLHFGPLLFWFSPHLFRHHLLSNVDSSCCAGKGTKVEWNTAQILVHTKVYRWKECVLVSSLPESKRLFYLCHQLLPWQ